MNKAAPRRQFKEDRVTQPRSTADDIKCDFALGPLDTATRAMDLKWGVNRLADLVSIETAQKFGFSCAKLNQAIEASNPDDAAAWSAVCIRGLAAMDAEATANNAPKANPEIWAVGQYCMIRDAAMWPAAQAQHPGAVIVTLAEVANALDSYKAAMPMIAEIKNAFPGAQITAIRQRSPLSDELEDEIPY